MKLTKPLTIVISFLLLLASYASGKEVDIKEMPGNLTGFFQITRMGPRFAQFQFESRDRNGSKPKRTVIEVRAEGNEDIRRAVVRKMIEVIRQYQKEDFNWESLRLDRTVMLSARVEDSPKLEDFMISEFFSDWSIEAARRPNSSPSHPEAIKTRGDGLFEITRMGPRSAQFLFDSRNTDINNPKREVMEVRVEGDEDIHRAVVRKMMELIRQYHKEDFNWESYRLGQVVVLSARIEDSKGLEDFLMREFFINDQRVQVDPKQVDNLRKKGIRGMVIAEGMITSEGTVREPIIIESPDPALEKTVIEAILKYRSEPLPSQTRNLAPSKYRETFNFGLTRTNEGISQFDLPKKTNHLPAEFQYDTPPVVKVVAPVVYPFKLLQDNITGSAKVTVIVDPEGNVREVQILEATHPEFGLATRGMVQSSEFEPATKDDKPTWGIFTLEQRFSRDAKGTEITQAADEILKKLKSGKQDMDATSALDSLPMALYKPRPAYPPHLLKEGIGDRVMIEFFIDEDGLVQLPRIVESKNDELAWIALTALSRWHFEPPLRHGRPTVTRIKLPINFSPSQKAK
jgi:TonB family protein